MKKYIILASATLAAIALIIGIRRVTAPSVTTVTLTTVETSAVRQTVECNGKVENSDSKEVYVDWPCVAREIHVSEGQRVKKGEALFSVDVEASQQVLSQWGSALPDVSASAIKETVTAPVSGVVKAVNVQKGGVADTSQPCVVIASGGGVHITVAVREKHLSRVAVGQEVEVRGVAFAKECYHGTLSQIAETARQEYIGASNETVVDAVVSLSEDEIDSSLRTGLNARATVVTEIIEQALLVPYECIGQNDAGEEFVYVYQDNGTAVRTVPTFGRECADGVLAVSGVAPGARLVQDPEGLSGGTVAVRVG